MANEKNPREEEPTSEHLPEDSLSHRADESLDHVPLPEIFQDETEGIEDTVSHEQSSDGADGDAISDAHDDEAPEEYFDTLSGASLPELSENTPTSDAADSARGDEDSHESAMQDEISQLNAEVASGAQPYTEEEYAAFVKSYESSRTDAQSNDDESDYIYDPDASDSETQDDDTEVVSLDDDATAETQAFDTSTDDFTDEYDMLESDVADSDYDDAVSEDVETVDTDENTEELTQVHAAVEDEAADDEEATTAFPPIVATEDQPRTRRERREMELRQKAEEIFATGSSETAVEDEPEEKKTGKKVGIIAGSILGAAALVAGGWWLIEEEPWAPNTVEVPAATSMIERGTEFATACELFETVDLSCEVELEATDDAPRGQLISQSIPAGEETEFDSEIVLTYANGPAESEFPNLRNNTIEETEELLYNMNIVITEIEEVDDSGLESGRVVSSSIEPGTTVENGDEVVLQISSGTVNIPDWTGETRELVSAEAESLGLEVEFIEEESDEAPGIVLDQNPPAGEENTSKVQVTIAKGFEEEMIEVPEVEDLSADEAQAELAAAGFRQITTVVIESSEISEGNVARVLPGEGEEVSSEENIYLLVVENE